jgi:hypothetical protein
MSEFKLTQEQVEMLGKAKTAAAKTRPVRQQSKKFVMLPYPEILEAAAAMNAPELAILSYLAYETWWQNKATVLLPGLPFRKAGFSRDAKIRGLRRLERIGLVQVIRRQRRNPHVRPNWGNGR